MRGMKVVFLPMLYILPSENLRYCPATFFLDLLRYQKIEIWVE